MLVLFVGYGNTQCIMSGSRDWGHCSMPHPVVRCSCCDCHHSFWLSLVAVTAIINVSRFLSIWHDCYLF